MNQRLSSTLLTRAALRASCRSEFLGSIFAEYVASENKDDRELADMLQVDVGNVDRLRICLRPHADSFASTLRTSRPRSEQTPPLLRRSSATWMRFVRCLRFLRR